MYALKIATLIYNIEGAVGHQYILLFMDRTHLGSHLCINIGFLRWKKNHRYDWGGTLELI